MYRLVLYYLIVLVIVAYVFAIFKLLAYSPFDIVLSTLVAIVAGFVSNFLFAKLFRAVPNIESVFITSLIVALIVPPTFPLYSIFLVGAIVLAMLSKYLITVEKRHIFNPAAIGIVIFVLLFPGVAANWWVGSKVMFVPVLVGGFLIVRKLEREKMVLTFFATYFSVTYFIALFAHSSPFELFNTWQTGLLSSPLLFFSLVMLTEPLTSPTRFRMRIIYAILIGFLYSTPLLKIGSFILTPEQALILGNIFSFFTISKVRINAKLKGITKLAQETHLLIFDTKQVFNYLPGQYLEWTLPHKHFDSRGVRRFFSIASAPNEPLMLLVKYFKNESSSFKRALFDSSTNREILANHLAGEFTLPKDTKRPLIFIAGGVGIAPFRSMIVDLVEKNEMRDIALFFVVKEENEIIFKDIFKKAEKIGLKTVHILTNKQNISKGWKGESGYIKFETLQKYVSNIRESLIYVSGPQMMVESIQKVLKQNKIKDKNVKVDFFPGYS